VTLLGLRVWGLAPGDRYDMGVEVAAVAAAAGSGPVHLAGFSAGATVALAAALTLGDSVRSVALLEPAFIGDDDWDPAETGWRAAIGSLRASGPPEQAEALRDMLMAPGEMAPPPRRPVAWNYRDDLLATMLSAHTGFESSDLVRIGVPVIQVRGGRSARDSASSDDGWQRCVRTSGNPCSRTSTTSPRRFASSRSSSRSCCSASGSRRERRRDPCKKSSPPRNDSITRRRYRGSSHGIRELGGGARSVLAWGGYRR